MDTGGNADKSKENTIDSESKHQIAERENSAEQGGKILWRGANVMMTIFFIMASGVQFNDPDPYLWVPLYGTAAILTVCIAIKPFLSENKRWIFLYWIHATFCVGMFFYVLIELLMAFSNPQSDGSINPLTYEEGRELAGVMITTIWLFTCKQSPTIRSKSKDKKKIIMLTTAIILFSILPLFFWVMCFSNVTDCQFLPMCTDFLSMDHYSF